ncbi:hypothetical protein H1R20_g6243, partial [Candolleomyces eurysporus]
MSRASTLLNRPSNAPMGPRTRNRSSNMTATSSFIMPLSPPSGPASSSLTASNLYLPEFGPVATVPESAPLPPISEAEPKPSALSSSPLPVEEPLPAPTIPEESEEPPDAVNQDAQHTAEEPVQEQLVENVEEREVEESQVEERQVEDGPEERAQEPDREAQEVPSYGESEELTPVAKTPSSITLSLPSAYSSAPSRTPSSSTVRTIAPSPKLTPPPPIRFESEPVQWKGMTLDAALWTFDSKELQAIVSRAIRSSAIESYIRLLTIECLDNTLPAELERLQSSKTITQAKYRFLVHRRTMQLQALLSSSLSPSNPKDSNEEGLLTNTKLVVQLSETVAECDLVMQELLKITDQIAQVQKLLDNHWASALAIALRKLNGSFGRRTSDLASAKEKIAQLEAALEEAWDQAEKMAREIDDIDGFSDDDEAIIETAEKVSVSLARATSPSPGPDSIPLTSLVLEGKPGSDARGPPPPLNLLYQSPLSSVSKSKGSSKGNQTPTDMADSVSIKSARSTKSAKSYRSTAGREPTRSATVSAARTRSYRASQSSLRLPAGVSRKQSNPSRPRTPYDKEEQLPPVPTLPIHFTPGAVMNVPSANASSTLLHETNAEANTPSSFNHHRRRTSLDSACGTYGHRTPIPWNSAMDDMYLESTKKESASFGLGRSLRPDSGIQMIPRVPPPVPPKVVPMEQYAARPRPKTPGKEHIDM